MAHLVNLKGQERSIAKRQPRVSSIGRRVVIPSHLLTSEDEAPSHKRSKKDVAVKSEVQRLRDLIAKKRGNNQNEVILPSSDTGTLPQLLFHHR